MTAETLKPFITTTTNAEHFLANNQNAAKSSQQENNKNSKNSKILSTTFGIIKMILYISLLGFTIWLFQRVLILQHEVKRLDVELQATARLLESIKNRLGLQYLEDLNEFKQELENTLIDDSHIFDDKDDSNENKTEKMHDDYDDYSDEKYDSYDDITKLYADIAKETDDDSEEDDNAEEDVSEDANFYDDFEKYQNSKKKRKTREIEAEEENKSSTRMQLEEEASAETENPKRRNHLHGRRHHLSLYKSDFIGNRHASLPKYHFLHKKHHVRRKHPKLKSGAQSSFAAKSIKTELNESNGVPAAHFQLNRKMPHTHASFKIKSYTGDVYIGHSVWSNEPNFFALEAGVLRIRVSGLYYIYAQICYNNNHDHNGFVIFHGDEPFLQCLNTVPTNSTVKIHTCHTSGIMGLQANETIHLRDFHTDRSVWLKDGNNRSFFGLIKL